MESGFPFEKLQAPGLEVLRINPLLLWDLPEGKLTRLDIGAYQAFRSDVDASNKILRAIKNHQSTLEEVSFEDDDCQLSIDGVINF